MLIAWEVGVRAGGLNELVVGSPTGIASAAWENVPDGRFWHHVRVSGFEFGIGFAAAVVIGIPLGLAAGWYRRIGYMISPWLDAFNAVPRIALLPLVIIWLGIGTQSKIMLVFLSAVGLITFNTFLGVRTVPPILLDVGRAFQIKPLRRFRMIVFPATIPFIVAGLRNALGAAVIGVIFAESYGATEGLGFLMQASAQRLDIDRYFFVVAVFTGFGALCFWILGHLERAFRARLAVAEDN